MNVFGHYYIANYLEPIAPPGLFERSLKYILRVVWVEEGLAARASERDEVETVRLLKSDESPRHGTRLSPRVDAGL